MDELAHRERACGRLTRRMIREYDMPIMGGDCINGELKMKKTHGGGKYQGKCDRVNIRM
jgi:hypothetical protein